MSVHAADLDGDGDPDVLSASDNDNKIAWYENLGGGAFSEQRVFLAETYRARSVHAVDLDGDNDLDVLASSHSFGIGWNENLGGGEFSDQRVITTDAVQADTVYAADLDGDSDPDVVSTDRSQIAWYENLGGGTFSGQRVISAEANDAPGVYAVDLDGDGDLDLVSGTSENETLTWYENLGGGMFSDQHVIVRDASRVNDVYAADLDGDGDPDVLAATSDGVRWYENHGSGFSQQQAVTAYSDAVPGVGSVKPEGDAEGQPASNPGQDHDIASDVTPRFRFGGLADSDGDGVPDLQDAFPYDWNDWLDSDGDRLGDNADPDDDGDGIHDVGDACPLDPDPSCIAESPLNALASFGSFHVIAHDLAEFDSHAAECSAQLGGGVRLADWNDVLDYYGNGGSVEAFTAGLRMSVEGQPGQAGEIGSGYRISRDGATLWGGNHHYFVARSEHNNPSSGVAHAHIDNYHLSLASWYGTGGYALCFGTLGGTGRILFEQDYESHPVDSLPDGYVIVFDGAGDVHQRVEAEGGNRQLRTEGRPGRSLQMREDFDFDLPAAVSVGWRMRVDTDTEDYGYADPETGDRFAHLGSFSVKNADEVGAVLGINKYQSAGRIVAYCPAGGGVRPELQVGEWASFRMDVDFMAGRSTMFMNDAMFCDTATQTVDLTDVLNSWSEHSGMQFGSGDSGDSITRFDDIVIRAMQ